MLERRAAQVLAIKLNQIERAEHGGAVVLPVAEQIKDRHAFRFKYWFRQSTAAQSEPFDTDSESGTAQS